MPEIYGGIRAPGTPAEGARDQSLGAIQTGGFAQAQIGGRKSIWIAQGAQSDIVRRPFTDAPYFPETANSIFEKVPGGKSNAP